MDTELVNLTKEFERVTIGEKLYTLTVSFDETIFQQVGDAESQTKSGDTELRINNKEICFVRKYHPNDGHRCCNSQHRYIIVSNKHLHNLSLKTEELSATIFSPTASDPSLDASTDACKQGVAFGSSLGIYHVLRTKKYRWRIAMVVCNFTSKESCDKWQLFLSNVLSSLNRPKRLLVFVNPFGGKGKASKVYKDCVEPVLRLCSIGVEVITTKRANHARDCVMEKDLREFDGIASVGGDGLFNEVVNGLLIRTQSDSRVDINNKDNDLVIPRCKLAAIPAGSTNALAFTVHGTGDPLTAVLHMALGDAIGVDVCGVYCGSEFQRFACTSCAYGFLGDVLKDSEELRKLGPPRYLVSGLKVAFRHPCYRGKLEMKSKSKGIILDSKSADNSDVVRSEFSLQQCHSKCELCKLTMLRNPQSKPIDIVVGDHMLDEEFVHLVGVVTPCITGLSPYGLSPNCHLGDGNMHLVIVSRISRCQNFCFISKVIRGRNGDHLMQGFVKLREVTEFSFTPSNSLANNKELKNVAVGHESLAPSSADQKKDLGTWNIDGELLSQPNGPIHFKMHRQLITMFACGIEREATANRRSSAVKLQSCVCCAPF